MSRHQWITLRENVRDGWDIYRGDELVIENATKAQIADALRHDREADDGYGVEP